MCKTKSNAGRPKRSKLESARAAFWVSNLSCSSGKSFSDLERELYPEHLKKRDGGGYTQPYAFDKYSNGSRIPNHKYDSVDSPVIRAENIYPGTKAAYDSIVWELMATSDQKVDTNKFYSQLSQLSKMRFKFYGVDLENRSQALLTDKELEIIYHIENIDVLGLMLLQINSNSETVRFELIHYIREWLLKSTLDYAPFKMCSNIIFEAIEERVVALGNMTGLFGLNVDDTEEDKKRSSTIASLFSGRTVLFRRTN